MLNEWRVNYDNKEVFAPVFALATMLEILVALNGCQKYKDVNSSSSKNTEEITAVELMKNGCGAAVTQLDSLSEESLKLLKESGITFIKVHIPVSFASDGTLTIQLYDC